MNLAELGVTFKAARIQSNRTQQEVANLTGVSRARISAFENGALPELGMVKVLALFEAVGLEVVTRPIGQGRTLDDLVEEQKMAPSGFATRLHNREIAPLRKRVRHGNAGRQHDLPSNLSAWLVHSARKRGTTK